jgi:hypothetical protein
MEKSLPKSPAEALGSALGMKAFCPGGRVANPICYRTETQFLPIAGIPQLGKLHSRLRALETSAPVSGSCAPDGYTARSLRGFSIAALACVAKAFVKQRQRLLTSALTLADRLTLSQHPSNRSRLMACPDSVSRGR